MPAIITAVGTALVIVILLAILVYFVELTKRPGILLPQPKQKRKPNAKKKPSKS